MALGGAHRRGEVRALHLVSQMMCSPLFFILSWCKYPGNQAFFSAANIFLLIFQKDSGTVGCNDVFSPAETEDLKMLPFCAGCWIKMASSNQAAWIFILVSFWLNWGQSVLSDKMWCDCFLQSKQRQWS